MEALYKVVEELIKGSKILLEKAEKELKNKDNIKANRDYYEGQIVILKYNISVLEGVFKVAEHEKMLQEIELEEMRQMERDTIESLKCPY